MAVHLLTIAEQRVTRLVAAGRSNDEVAAVLGLDAAAVSAHLSAVLRKLGARSRAELRAHLAAAAEVEKEG
jgi:DNA-binding CsgD family transcriptional regulator